MSVIEALKGKITNVQQDISAGFKSMTVSRKRTISITPNTEGVSLDAGADLLHLYHENWAQISHRSADNAKRAEVIDRDIVRMRQVLLQQQQSVNGLLRLVNTLPELITTINSAMTKLGSLECDINEVENMLVTLEDICEQQDQHNNKMHHQHLLAQYTDKKNTELEQIKSELAVNHSQKIQGYESRIQELLREKQLAFEDDYKKEMEHYKQTGHTNFKPTVSRESSVEIEDIDIAYNEDTTALNDFLNTKLEMTSDTLPASASGAGDAGDPEDEVESDEDKVAVSEVKVKEDEDIEEVDKINSSANESAQENVHPSHGDTVAADLPAESKGLSKEPDENCNDETLSEAKET